MGASKVPLYAYVDETGNTGHNIFDPVQPDFYTAALVTKGDFDLTFSGRANAIAKKLGEISLHGKDLGIAKLESVAPDILALLTTSEANFFVSRVEKKYLLATKIFDTLFDSGENAAVAWHHYNIRPLKIMLAFKVGAIVDLETARLFWNCILEPSEQKALALLPNVCSRLLENLANLPDARSREILGEGLQWARDHPESIQIHTDRKSARQGHFPNMVAFSNLLEGLEDFSRRLKRPVARITHDKQSEFQKTLEAWHALYANASPEPITWAGETYTWQRVAGSTFEVKADELSPGIQIADIVLWLYHQFKKQRALPEGCLSILEHVLKKGWESDFSFEGVEKSYLRQWGTIITSPLPPEKKDQARELIMRMEKSRQSSMERYERDKLPPFMRPRPENGNGPLDT